MKRSDIERVFPGATDEQIDAVLNAAGADLTEANRRAGEAAGKLEDALRAAAELTEANVALKGRNAELEKRVEAGMSAEELLAQREAEAAAKEREYALKANELDARAIFQEAGLPLADESVRALVASVVTEDAEGTRALATQIAGLTKAQREQAAADKQAELLRSNPTLVGAADGGAPMTKEAFAGLSFAEQVRAIDENPELLKSLS